MANTLRLVPDGDALVQTLVTPSGEAARCLFRPTDGRQCVLERYHDLKVLPHLYGDLAADIAAVKKLRGIEGPACVSCRKIECTTGPECFEKYVADVEQREPTPIHRCPVRIEMKPMVMWNCPTPGCGMVHGAGDNASVQGARRAGWESQAQMCKCGHLVVGENPVILTSGLVH